MQAATGKSHRSLQLNISNLNSSLPTTPSHILNNRSQEMHVRLRLLKLLVSTVELIFWIIVALDHYTL